MPFILNGQRKEPDLSIQSPRIQDEIDELEKKVIDVVISASGEISASAEDEKLDAFLPQDPLQIKPLERFFDLLRSMSQVSVKVSPDDQSNLASVLGVLNAAAMAQITEITFSKLLDQDQEALDETEGKKPGGSAIPAEATVKVKKIEISIIVDDQGRIRASSLEKELELFDPGPEWDFEPLEEWLAEFEKDVPFFLRFKLPGKTHYRLLRTVTNSCSQGGRKVSMALELTKTKKN